MPKKVREMEAAEVRALRHGRVEHKAKGRAAISSKARGEPCTKFHSVGGAAGLILICKPPTGDGLILDKKSGRFYELDGKGKQREVIGARSWILRAVVGEDRKQIGLGPYPEVSLAQAREEARELRRIIRKGRDPVAEKKEARAAMIAEQQQRVPFSKFAADYIKLKETTENKKGEMITDKTARRIRSEFAKYITPYLGDKIVGEITRDHVIDLLTEKTGLWEDKRYTGDRIRTHIEGVMAEAIDAGKYVGNNPASWARLKNRLAPVGKAEDMPWLDPAKVHKFYAELVEKNTLSALVLRFQVLTGVRPGNARLAEWSEVDLDNKLWELPGSKMKTGERFRQPLCKPALDILRELKETRGGGQYVFAKPDGKPVSDSMISRLPKKMGHPSISAHGFRKTLSTWREDFADHYSMEVGECALAHAKGGMYGVYGKSDFLAQRRKMLREWGEFVLHGPRGRIKGDGANVVQGNFLEGAA